MEGPAWPLARAAQPPRAACWPSGRSAAPQRAAAPASRPLGASAACGGSRCASTRARGKRPSRAPTPPPAGKQSLETICLLLAYKIKYPENFFLLRGNHECASINRIYGFYDECKRRYNIKMWKKFQEAFNVMPFAAVRRLSGGVG